MSKNGIPLNFIAIYGPNGSGKSNIVRVFDVLYDSFQTLNIKKMIFRLAKEHSDSFNSRRIEEFDLHPDVASIINLNKTINSSGNMLLEIGFYLNGKNGTYLIEFDSNRVIHEKLEYILSQNKGLYFEISPSVAKLNSVVFGGLRKDILLSIKKYWGKHSVISIINNIREEYETSYFTENVSPSLISLIDYLNSFYVYMAAEEMRSGIIGPEEELSPDKYMQGELPLSKERLLNETEKLINRFFVSTYKDIEKAYFEKEIRDNIIRYRLLFSRFISGKKRIVPFSEESTGTKNLVYLLPYLYAANKKKVVVIDEIDNGIHDVLFRDLMKIVFRNTTGQMIITTHNTLLLNEYYFKDSFYFIDIDENGKRTINTPSDFGYRIQHDSNVAINYLNNRFKGLPYSNSKDNIRNFFN